MKIGILGSGMVGQEVGTRLIENGDSVCMGSRKPDNEKGLAWQQELGDRASNHTFDGAAEFAEKFIFNCTSGMHSIEALDLVKPKNLQNKILIDVANPLDFSEGLPPSLAICNTDSLAEQIQIRFPALHVVKSLNTMNCKIMLQPDRIKGRHNVFMCGNDRTAKMEVRQLLKRFNWSEEDIMDLGDITAARGMEMILPIWLRLWGALGTADFNFFIQR